MHQGDTSLTLDATPDEAQERVDEPLRRSL